MHETHWLTVRFPLKRCRNYARNDLKRVEAGQVWGRVRLLELGSEARGRWRSRGGRPTAPEWSIRRLVPFEERLWRQIQAYAPTVGLTPGQVAALLIERGARGLAWMGGREARFPTAPARTPSTTIASEPPPGTPPPPHRIRPRWPAPVHPEPQLPRLWPALRRVTRIHRTPPLRPVQATTFPRPPDSS